MPLWVCHTRLSFSNAFSMLLPMFITFLLIKIHTLLSYCCVLMSGVSIKKNSLINNMFIFKKVISNRIGLSVPSQVCRSVWHRRIKLIIIVIMLSYIKMLFIKDFSIYVIDRKYILTIRQSLILVYPLTRTNFYILSLSLWELLFRFVYSVYMHANVCFNVNVAALAAFLLPYMHANAHIVSPLSQSIEHAHFSSVIFWNNVKFRFWR